jgi:tRNA-2-methylthio-N6-dimethylallyladenosine synthase
MLKMMNRGYTVGEYDEFIDRCRQYLHQPEIGRPLMLSGDIIVGFPTETDADFEATVRLLERSRYKNCFIFKYSPRPGTVAFDKIPDDVPESVKRERNNRLLAVQAEISARDRPGADRPRVRCAVRGPQPRRTQEAGHRREARAPAWSP